MTTILKGKKDIMRVAGASWPTIITWKRHRGFPVKLLNRRWYSEEKLIEEWVRRQIRENHG